jgi:hypothetical protein
MRISLSLFLFVIFVSAFSGTLLCLGYAGAL